MPMNPNTHNIENVIKPLLADPTSFDFFEAVRKIQRLALYAQKSVGGDDGENPTLWGGPLAAGLTSHGPIVYFRSNVSNSFPASSIQDVVLIQNNDRQGRKSKKLEMTVNFMGLHGPNGVLPRHYNDLLIQLQRNNLNNEANALRDWFDLFNNRIIALFYLAWERTQLPVQQEQSEISGQRDPFQSFFKCLGGIQTGGLQRRIQVSVPSFGGSINRTMSDLFLSTKLARSRPRMSVALVQNILSKATEAPVQISCFTPKWSVIPDHALARLGSLTNSTQAQLGVNVSLGKRILNSQSNYTINIGPVDWRGLNRLLPPSNPLNKSPSKTMLDAVRTLASLKTDPTLKPTIRIRLRSDSLQSARLGLHQESSGLDQPSKLGWNTWLGEPNEPAGIDDQLSCKYYHDTEFEEV